MSSGIPVIFLKRGITKLRNRFKCYTKEFPGATAAGREKWLKKRTISENMPVRKFLFKGKLGRMYAILITEFARWCLCGLILCLNQYFHVFYSPACVHSNSFSQHGSHIRSVS